MSARKLDIYCHVMPQRFLSRMRELAPELGDIVKRVSSIRLLHDIPARIEMMDQWSSYQQVIALANPPIEVVAGPEDSPALARLGNDEVCAISLARPDKFPAWIASLPMNNVPAALEEMDRALALGARGVQIFTNVNGRPLDDPEFFPIFDRMANHHDLPIFLHPARSATVADYSVEALSKFEIWQVLGWPYETSVAMARMVFSGFFDRLPKLQVLTHHLGAMIPFFEGRVGPLWDQLGSRTSHADYASLLKGMKQRPIEYFRMFYGDTAVGGSKSALTCGLNFFGVDRVLFASDCPFDPEGGAMFIRETIKALDELPMSEQDRDKIFYANALRLLRMPADP